MTLFPVNKKCIIAVVFGVAVILYFVYGFDVNKFSLIKRRLLNAEYPNPNRTHDALAAALMTNASRRAKLSSSSRNNNRGERLLAQYLQERLAGPKSQILPNAIVIGVRKGGTRALLRALKLNPGIHISTKEVHFFDRDENYKKGLEWYRSKMPFVTNSPGHIVIEKTPAYFVTCNVPERVHNMSRTVKFLLVLRDPTRRAISDYTQLNSKTSKMPPFEKYVTTNRKQTIIKVNETCIRIGRYIEHLQNWLRVFPLSQFHIVSGEMLATNPVVELQAVEKFLNLESVITEGDFYFNKTKGFPCFRKNPLVATKKSYHCLGKTKGRRHPVVREDIITLLQDYYRPYNKRLYKFVGRDFGWP